MRDPQHISEARLALGRQLAGWRQASGLTQEALAPLVCYSRSSIANIETGKQRTDRAFWEQVDSIVGADGELLATFEQMEHLTRQRVRPTHSSALMRAVMMKELHDFPQLPVHLPNRPSWLCKACAMQWPCEQRRAELLFNNGDDKVWLTMYMSLYLVDAVVDLRILPSDTRDIVMRFLGWLHQPGADLNQDESVRALLKRFDIEPEA